MYILQYMHREICDRIFEAGTKHIVRFTYCTVQLHTGIVISLEGCLYGYRDCYKNFILASPVMTCRYSP
jgi:hypothetical protein